MFAPFLGRWAQRVSRPWKNRRPAHPLVVVGFAASVLVLAGCSSVPDTPKAPRAQPSRPAPGQEIIVAGERIPAGTRVVTWLEPRGYNAYAGRGPFSQRRNSLPVAEQQRIARRGWTRASLAKVVDQFVLHYDACGLSRICFDVLQKRQLSVHFLLDIDGTIYQTIDLKERAAHATTSNDRSIGIEIANIGAFPPGAAQPLDQWYRRTPDGRTHLTIPARIANPGVLTPNFRGRPARPGPIAGSVHQQSLLQYDLTPEQYAALTKLTAALCRTFPKLRAEIPRDRSGRVLMRKLPDAELARYRGVLGHFHLQENKVDPGPAFQWERFITDVRAQLR